MTNHISPDEFEAFFLKQSTSDQIASLEEHLLLCPLCQDQAVETELQLLALRLALHSREPTLAREGDPRAQKKTKDIPAMIHPLGGGACP